jgi:hypothetical protein
VIAAAAALGLAVPGAYLALGGGSYDSSPVADPCQVRDWRNPSGAQRVAEQIVLSTLDGIACEVGSTREELVLALPSAESRAAFARSHGLDADGLDRVTRRGLDRAISDAEHAGALAGWQAALLRQAAQRIPLDTLLDAVNVLG